MIQRNSSGIQAGLCPPSHTGRIAPPLARTFGISITIHQLFQPAAVRRGVIVDERDDLALGECDPTVARISEALPPTVVRNPDAFSRQFAKFLLKAGIVIDDDNDLLGRVSLILQRCDRFSHLREPVVRIRANDDGCQRLIARRLARAAFSSMLRFVRHE